MSGRAIIKDLLTLMAPSGVSREAAYCNHYLSLSLSLSQNQSTRILEANQNIRQIPTALFVECHSLFYLSRIHFSLQPLKLSTPCPACTLYSLVYTCTSACSFKFTNKLSNKTSTIPLSVKDVPTQSLRLAQGPSVPS